MRTFCTALDADHLIQGLALHRSLARHAPGVPLWVLCLDRATERALDELSRPDLHVLTLAEVEASEPELRQAKVTRTRAEYHLTCLPALAWHLLTRVPGAAPVTLLGADLYFFSSPAGVLEESARGSIAILPHRFAPACRQLERHGLHDPSWVTFLDDRAGREALAWWRNRCLEWCHDRLEDGRFGHQKYLDDWPTRFEGVHILAHEGAGVAPWNVAAHPIRTGPGGPRAGEAPLVFYRFDALARITRRLFDPGLERFGAAMTPALRDAVYLPYLAEARAIEHELRRTLPGLSDGWPRPRGGGLAALIRHALGRRLLAAP
jgi:hypothetical protein